MERLLFAQTDVFSAQKKHKTKKKMLKYAARPCEINVSVFRKFHCSLRIEAQIFCNKFLLWQKRCNLALSITFSDSSE